MRGFIELSRVGVAPVAGLSQACRTHKHTGPEADCASDRRLVVRPSPLPVRYGLPVAPRARPGPPLPLPRVVIPGSVPVDSPALIP